MYVLLLDSVLGYDPFSNWMKKMIDSGNSEAFSLPLKFGPLAVWVGNGGDAYIGYQNFLHSLGPRK